MSLPSTGSSTKLNFAAVSVASGLPKDVCSAVVEAVLQSLKRCVNGSGASTMRLSFLPVCELSYRLSKAGARDSSMVDKKNIVVMKFLPSFLEAAGAKPVTARNVAKLGNASNFATKVRSAAIKQGKWPDPAARGRGNGAAGRRPASRAGSSYAGSERSDRSHLGAAAGERRRPSRGAGGSRHSDGHVSQTSDARLTAKVVDKVTNIILSRGGQTGIRGLARYYPLIL